MLVGQFFQQTLGKAVTHVIVHCNGCMHAVCMHCMILSVFLYSPDQNWFIYSTWSPYGKSILTMHSQGLICCH